MSKIFLVGEARGRKEDLFNHGFVGSSGAELARMLAQAGIAPELPTTYPSELDMMAHWKRLKAEYEISIANVFNFHPQDNNIDLCFTNVKEGIRDLPPAKPGKYLRPDLLFHVEALWQDIRDAKPNLVIAFGNTACWAILGETKISAIRGTVKISKRLDVKVLPTYHPAAVLRQWALRPIVVTDLEKAKREAEYSDIKRIKRFVTIEPTLAEISEWFQRPADFYAVDIETSIAERPLGHIAMIGFARSPADALVIPFADECKPNWSFWEDPSDELQAWRFVEQGLRKPVPKVFQNGVFDISYILRSGLRPTMCADDTMLLHHALYPEMLKGLGFLGSIYSDELAWKQMRTKGNNLKRDE